jgi:hypothetical protein
MSSKERSRRNNFPLQVASAAPCQLEADSEEKENASPSTTSKIFSGSCLSGENETG